MRRRSWRRWRTRSTRSKQWRIKEEEEVDGCGNREKDGEYLGDEVEEEHIKKIRKWKNVGKSEGWIIRTRRTRRRRWRIR